jgi:type II secretory pathway component PulJ
MLQARAQDLQRVRALQREMAALRDELLLLAARVSSVESEVQDWEQLEKKIQQVQVSSILHFKAYGRSGVDAECRAVSSCGMCNSVILFRRRELHLCLFYWAGESCMRV